MATKKYINLNNLSTFLTVLRETFAEIGHKHSISDVTDYVVDTELSATSNNPVQNNVINTEFEAVATAMNALEDAIDGKSDSTHTHDDRYYTESEIDSKISEINQNTQSYIDEKISEIPSVDGYTKTEVDNKLSYKADSTHNHDSDYDTKGAAASALASAQAYADSAAATVKNDLLNGAGDAYNTLKELGDLIDTNVDAIEALETVAAGKADKSHSHAISDVSGLQSALDGKAAASHSHTVANITDLTATATELNYMDGVTSNVQTQIDGKAASGHSHSAATTSASGFMTADMVTKLNGIATGANKTTVDSALSSSSTNPVQNKVVNSAISTLTSTVSANTSSISSHTTAISNLQTAVSEIQDITSEEIQALFA